jgi:hypothetical protein
VMWAVIMVSEKFVASIFRRDTSQASFCDLFYYDISIYSIVLNGRMADE